MEFRIGTKDQYDVAFSTELQALRSCSEGETIRIGDVAFEVVSIDTCISKTFPQVQGRYLVERDVSGKTPDIKVQISKVAYLELVGPPHREYITEQEKAMSDFLTYFEKDGGRSFSYNSETENFTILYKDEKLSNDEVSFDDLFEYLENA